MTPKRSKSPRPESGGALWVAPVGDVWVSEQFLQSKGSKASPEDVWLLEDPGVLEDLSFLKDVERQKSSLLS